MAKTRTIPVVNQSEPPPDKALGFLLTRFIKRYQVAISKHLLLGQSNRADNDGIIT